MARCHSGLFVYWAPVKLVLQTFEKLESQHTRELSQMLKGSHRINFTKHLIHMNKTGLYNQTTLDIYCIAQKNIEPNWHADAYAIVKMLLMCAVKKATVI